MLKIYMQGETIYENAAFIVYDMTGREMKRITDINTSEFQIDMTGFSNGIYFYKYVQGDYVLSNGKFVIAN